MYHWINSMKKSMHVILHEPVVSGVSHRSPLFWLLHHQPCETEAWIRAPLRKARGEKKQLFEFCVTGFDLEDGCVSVRVCVCVRWCVCVWGKIGWRVLMVVCRGLGGGGDKEWSGGEEGTGDVPKAILCSSLLTRHQPKMDNAHTQTHIHTHILSLLLSFSLSLSTHTHTLKHTHNNAILTAIFHGEAWKDNHTWQRWGMVRQPHVATVRYGQTISRGNTGTLPDNHVATVGHVPTTTWQRFGGQTHWV